MLPKTINTSELRALTGYSAAGITELVQSGLISRSAKDTWAFPSTVLKIVGHLRERGRREAVADDRSRFERARAQREEMKAMKEAGKLCPVSDLEQLADFTATSWKQALREVTIQIAGANLAERTRIEAILGEAQDSVRQKFEAEAKRLTGKPGDEAAA
jgi:hypothetical protein